MTKTFLAVSVVALLSACDKSGSSSSASAAQADLLKSVPASSNVVFGGDVMKVEKLMADLTGRLPDAQAKGMKAYVDCFMQSNSNLQIAGGVLLTGGKPDIRVVMSGMDIPKIEKCATDAGFKVTKDADGKFISLEIQGTSGTMQQSYLALASGALYSQQQLGMRHGAPATRADLEAEAASAQKASAATDQKVQAMIGKADKGRMLWFAGNAAGTPMGAKIGEVFGSLDVNPDVALTLDVQITDDALATQIDGYMGQAKSFAAMSSDLKSVIDNLEYKKDGDHLHFSLKVTQEQIQNLVKTLGGMMGMMRGH
jgi:hypothetical protein